MNQKYADVVPLADALEYMASWRAQKDNQNA
jgi:hypothetical protein